MENNSYKEFCSQLRAVEREYPNLGIKEISGKHYLKGIIDIYNDHLEYVRSYSIEIHWKEGFPYRFPLLYEVGGDIENSLDFHKFEDDMCCITVLPDEILKCRYGVSLIEYVEKYAIGYLANQVYRNQTGEYKNGEYAHDTNSLIQFYSVFFKTPSPSLWIKWYNVAFRERSLNNERNMPCPCGSEKKYKYCHDRVIYDLRFLGEKHVATDFFKINTYINEKKNVHRLISRGLPNCT